MKGRGDTIFSDDYFQPKGTLTAEQEEQVKNWIKRWNEKVQAKKEKLLEKVKVSRKRSLQVDERSDSPKKARTAPSGTITPMGVEYSLPDDIVTHIFSFLDGLDLIFAGAVS